MFRFGREKEGRPWRGVGIPPIIFAASHGHHQVMRTGAPALRKVKQMTDPYRYIGTAVPRKDAVDIVTGGVRFLNDINLPGMLYGKVLRSPHAHALIKRINKSQAEDMPGV